MDHEKREIREMGPRIAPIWGNWMFVSSFSCRFRVVIGLIRQWGKGGRMNSVRCPSLFSCESGMKRIPITGREVRGSGREVSGKGETGWWLVVDGWWLMVGLTMKDTNPGACNFAGFKMGMCR